MLRHLFLNTIRMYRKQFHPEYGEVVLCLESSDCWRKEVFPNYKANRKKKVKDESHDWNQVFGYFEQYLSEISRTFPYMQLRVPHTEADDIIAVVCQQFHCDEKIMILSNDKDFMQLQRYPSIATIQSYQKELLSVHVPGFSFGVYLERMPLMEFQTFYPMMILLLSMARDKNQLERSE